MVFEYFSSVIIEYKWVFLFYISLTLLIYAFRKRFDKQGLIYFYRTKVGLKLMDRISTKHRELVKWIGYISIGVSFLGLLLITGMLLKNLIDLLINPATPAAVSPVLPGFRVPGTTIKIPLISGWIALFVVILVHEFSHGVVARAHNLKVKSSGIFFMVLAFIPIMGAFVEPEEKKLRKQSDITQYSVYAIAPFSNMILTIFAALLLVFLVNPIAGSFVEPLGFELLNIAPGLPAEEAGLEAGMIITQLNNNKIIDGKSLEEVMRYTRPKEEVNIVTNSGEFTLTTTADPKNEKIGYLGVQGGSKITLKDNTTLTRSLYAVFSWLAQFLMWLAVLSIGIGLVNLFPMFITDGARMLQVTFQQIRGPEKGDKLWKQTNMFCLFVLIAIISIALFKWIFNITFV